MPTATKVPTSVELLQRDFDHGVEVIRQIADMQQTRSNRQPLAQHDVAAIENAHKEMLTAYARFPYKTRLTNHSRMRRANTTYNKLRQQ